MLVACFSACLITCIVGKKKDAGELGEFDPSSSAVHEDSRIRTIITIDMVNGVARSTRAWGYTSSLASLSDLTEPSESDQEGDDDWSEDEYRQDQSMPTRTNSRPIRAAAGKGRSRATTQTKLPFSPKKLRSRHVRRYMTESEDELAGYEQEDIIDVIPPRRSARERKSAKNNLAEDYVDETDDSESSSESFMETSKRAGKSKAVAKTRKLKRGPVSRPAYGNFRSVKDIESDAYEEETELLRAHRDICEKCHKAPAHVQLEKPKKGRKKTRKEDDDGFDENEDDLIRSLGGWVRW